MKINPILACDFYKVGHKFQYPQGTEEVYSNLTARSSRLANKLTDVFNEKIVFFGLQGFIKEFLIESFNEGFFSRPVEEVVAEYNRRTNTSLGDGSVDSSHIRELHALGYLPLEIKAIDEGSLVDIKVPVLTVKNTLPEFFWLTNYIETVLSAELWKACTSATTAYQYKKLFDSYAEKTGSPADFTYWQGHDFSFRGMSGADDAAKSGAGHLLSFLGTDTIPAIEYLEQYYYGKDTFVGGSVPATEHSVMCAGGKEDEVATIRRIIKDVYPSGVVSVVSDTWDFWNVITSTAKELMQDIISRKPNSLGMAKVVFRPDSGDPVKIICGDSDAEEGSPAHIGAVECLWNIFGGTTTSNGYKVLNERVGIIYGDSITLERAKDILSQLEKKGFASCNVVFGIGSFTYQYTTRDSYGFAMKATYAKINGEGVEIYKDPATDSGTKKSAKGLLRVEKEGGRFVLYDQQTEAQEALGCLTTVFKNGQLIKEDSVQAIRQRLLFN